MSGYGASTVRFHWNGYQLCFGKKKLTYELRRASATPSMYYCSTPFGDSVDYYNLSRARQHLIDLYREDRRSK